MITACLLLPLLVAGQSSAPPVEAVALERDNLEQLLAVRRIFVDRLSGGETAIQIRDMIIGSLERSKLFAITENPERADAVLRGSAEDLVFTETFSSADDVDARGTMGVPGTSGSNGRRGGYASAGVGGRESLHTTERRHEASASVRLSTKAGDVIWSTTQESMGGKFRGASADVASKITKELVTEFERARKLRDKPE